MKIYDLSIHITLITFPDQRFVSVVYFMDFDMSYRHCEYDSVSRFKKITSRAQNKLLFISDIHSH